MKRLRITVDGKAYDVVVESLDEPANPNPVRIAQGSPTPLAPSFAPPSESPAAPAAKAAGPGEVASPLAGRVVSVDCAVGQAVEAGATLMTLEAMKMNTLIHAPVAGTVGEIRVNAGDPVEEGQILAVIA